MDVVTTKAKRERERGVKRITARVLAINGGVQPRAGLPVAMATL